MEAEVAKWVEAAVALSRVGPVAIHTLGTRVARGAGFRCRRGWVSMDEGEILAVGRGPCALNLGARAAVWARRVHRQ